MSAENPCLEDFGFDSKELMIEVQRETMGKLIAAEKEIARLTAENAKYKCPIGLDNSPMLCSAGTCVVCQRLHEMMRAALETAERDQWSNLCVKIISYRERTIAELRDTVEHYRADAAHDEALINRLRTALEEIARLGETSGYGLGRAALRIIARKALANEQSVASDK